MVAGITVTDRAAPPRDVDGEAAVAAALENERADRGGLRDTPPEGPAPKDGVH